MKCKLESSQSWNILAVIRNWQEVSYHKPIEHVDNYSVDIYIKHIQWT